jgi:hypothetical protein
VSGSVLQVTWMFDFMPVPTFPGSSPDHLSRSKDDVLSLWCQHSGVTIFLTVVIDEFPHSGVSFLVLRRCVLRCDVASVSCLGCDTSRGYADPTNIVSRDLVPFLKQLTVTAFDADW